MNESLTHTHTQTDMLIIPVAVRVCVKPQPYEQEPHTHSSEVMPGSERERVNNRTHFLQTLCLNLNTHKQTKWPDEVSVIDYSKPA